MNMIFFKVLLIYIIAIKKLSCERIVISLANQKQQKLLEDSKDLSANPCEDFNQYACGKWQNLHPQAGEKYNDTLGLLDYNVNKEMAGIFSAMDLRNEPKYVKTTYHFFKSCNDLKKYETVHYLKWMTKQENIEFPLLGNSNDMENEFNWLKTLAIMRIYGLNGIFINENVVQKGEDPSKFIMYLKKPVFDEEFILLKRDNLEQIIKYLGEPINSTIALHLWHEINAFELDLKSLNYIEHEVESEEDSELDWTLQKVNDLKLPWIKDYIQILLNQTELNPNMEIYLHNKPYFKDLDDLLKQRSQHFLSKYLEIRFLWHLHQQLPKNVTAEDCIANVRKFLPAAIYWLYEQQHPDLQEEYSEVFKIFDDIRKDFSKTIEKNEYRFNETVLDFLLDKIKNMQLKINNIPRIDTVQVLENFYNNLDLSINDFYGNQLKLMKFNFYAVHKLLNNTTQYKDFFYLQDWNTGASSSPYYIQRSNTVVVPLSLLQQPLYYPNLNDIYKYSSLGFLLAHEIYHGFDNNGLEFDHKGIRVSQLYNDIFAYSRFYGNFNCLLEHKTSVVDKKMADISGLHYAYKIFKDSRTDDMDVSLSELFFLNFAQFFCGASYTDTFYPMTTQDLNRERITDVLSYFSEFSKVFKCNNNNRMYSRKECHIWHR